MNRVGLHVFADRMSGDFSGGNKRKLSTAIALIGDPSLICLDEPTSGMDAKARRLLWNDILSLIKENRIVILTSHSMEECEALCTRLVIMVNGQFKCLGSPQHLKRKFGNGYKLAVRIYNENDKQLFFDFMRTQFPFSTIQESHKNLFEYILPFESTKLSDIFGKLEKNRDQLKIKDYSVSQTTLDQIFVNFAKNQNDQDPFTDEYRPIDAFQPSTPISNPLEINSNELFQQHDVINNVIQVEQVEEKKRINDNTLQQSHNELNREDEPQKEIETERSFSFQPNKSPSNPSLSSTSSSSSALPQQVNFNIEPLIFNNDISDKDRTQIIGMFHFYLIKI
jgi:energy-coupling factor transporter ATP-binding protein EcfA2